MIKHTILFIFALFFLNISVLYADESLAFTKISPQGDKALNGIFDLSVEYGADGVGWMAYSRVSVPEFVSTHLAKSMDNGASWTYVSTINKSSAEDVRVKGKSFKGVWRYETPSLVYDPRDIPARRWKLFSQRYYVLPPFKKDDGLMREGWIEYKSAPSPEGPWSKPECLFGQKKHNCRVQPNSLHPSLSGNLFYNEVGAFFYNGVLYMSLDANTAPSGVGDWEKRKTVLFSSNDKEKSWRYNGVLTDYNDASGFGYFALTGTSLIEYNGNPYLLITPSGKKGLLVKNRAHDGCYLVAFEDISRAKLKRDSTGRLAIIKELSPEYNSGGLCDYHQNNSKGGVLFSQIDMKKMPEIFGIYSTHWMPRWTQQ